MVESLKKNAILILFGILALAAFLRFHQLGFTSLVIDEITYVTDSDPSKSIRETWRALFASYPSFHRPPMPVVLQLASMKAAHVIGLPMNEVVYRVPAALMGVASVWTLFLLGRRLFGLATGLVAAFLLGISFFHIYHSREVYMYSPYFFFALLSWWFLAEIVTDIWNAAPYRPWVLIGYAISSALTLQMHMTAIFFLAAHLLIVLISFGWEPLRSQPLPRRLQRIAPFLAAYVLAWLSFAPTIIHFIRHYRSDDEKLLQTVGIGSFLKMFGEMCWGSQLVPLTIFLCLIVAGIWFAIRADTTRRQAILCLVVGGIVMLGVAYASRRARFESRYFQLVQPTLLLFVAVAWVRFMESALRKIPEQWRALCWIAPCVGVLFWNVPFYQQLFQLKGKIIAGRPLAEWINTNVPEGGVYLFDYPWARVDVPTMYPTPGRIAMCVSPPIHEAYDDPERPRKLLEFTKDVFRRFPDFHYIDTQHAHLDGSTADSSGWCQEVFRNHVRIENPALPRLFEMGILPSGAFYADGKGRLKHGLVADLYRPTDIFYNTRDDLMTMRRAAGHKSLALFGKGWTCSQLNDGTIWRGLQAEGTIDLYGLADTPTKTAVVLVCANFGEDQSVVVNLQGKETVFDLPTKRLTRVSLGEIVLQPGHTAINVHRKTPQRPEEFPSVLGYEILANQAD